MLAELVLDGLEPERHLTGRVSLAEEDGDHRDTEPNVPALEDLGENLGLQPSDGDYSEWTESEMTDLAGEGARLRNSV